MNYIERKLKHYPSIYKTEQDVYHQMLCVLGNGIHLNVKGYLADVDEDESISPTTKPTPFTSIYPFYKPVYTLKYKGCRTLGFKEVVQFVIDCINLSSDNVSDIKEWKNNIHVLEELLSAEDIKDPYKDISIEDAFYVFEEELKENTTTTAQECNNTNPKESVRDIKYFDVQWSDCPVLVLQEVRQLWFDMGYGNDHYVHHTKLNDELYSDYPRIYMWLKRKDVQVDEDVIIHWWW